jgi:glycosyltransferase involved in cell wall biosynthesis
MKVAIIGTVGVPACYGGFETLVDNLARYNEAQSLGCELTVYCSAKSYQERLKHFYGASLQYLPLNANGAQSLPYDLWSMLLAWRQGADVLLVLGVSGAIGIPLLRLLTSMRIVTNVDGIEWKRAKWKGLSRWFLRFSERIASRWSHNVIADNIEIARHITNHYGVPCCVIPYGGDHVLGIQASASAAELRLPRGYALSICRIEPENNVAMIIEAFALQDAVPLVFVGNWNASPYGQKLKQAYSVLPHLHLLDPIYDASKLRALHDNAALYLHGHSAGGTNPSLVEAMHCHAVILAFDCNFNRATTEGAAEYFQNASQLGMLLERFAKAGLTLKPGVLKEIADRRYLWSLVAHEYFEIIGCVRPLAVVAHDNPL